MCWRILYLNSLRSNTPALYEPVVARANDASIRYQHVDQCGSLDEVSAVYGCIQFYLRQANKGDA